MAINIPSAAGFIPQESVLDGLLKLYKTFGPTAKSQDAANVAETKARTGQIGAQTGYVGAQTAALPTMTANDTIRANATATGANASMKNATTEEAKLPTWEADTESRIDERKSNATYQNKTLTNRQNEFQQSILQQINEQADKNKFNEQQLSYDAMRTKETHEAAQATMGLAKGRNDREEAQNSIEAALKIYNTMAVSGDPVKIKTADDILFNLLKKTMPEDVARGWLDRVRHQAQMKSEYAPKTKQPTPIPGLPDMGF